jgi:hypothetical protein
MALSLKMELKMTPELRQLGIRVGIGLALLAIVAYVLVVMPIYQGRKLDADIAAAKADLVRQQSLAPALASLRDDAQNASIMELMPPKSQPVERTRVYLMPDQVGQLARDLNVEPLDLSLDPASLGDDPGAIRLTGVFSGKAAACRRLLMAIGALPSLARIERVEMRAVDGHIEMLVQMRVALTK